MMADIAAEDFALADLSISLRTLSCMMRSVDIALGPKLSKSHVATAPRGEVSLSLSLFCVGCSLVCG